MDLGIFILSVLCVGPRSAKQYLFLHTFLFKSNPPSSLWPWALIQGLFVSDSFPDGDQDFKLNVN